MKIGACYSRFRIIHSGHLELIEKAEKECDTIVIGVSNHSKFLRSVEIIKQYYPQLKVEYYKNPFTMLKENPQITDFYVGEDRIKLGQAIQKSFRKDFHVHVRNMDNISSTRCRELYQDKADIKQYLESGVARNEYQALQIIAQSHLEFLYGN